MATTTESYATAHKGSKDIDLDDKLAEGFMHLRHSNRCHCPNSLRLDVMLEYARRKYEHHAIDESEIGAVVLLIKLGIASPDEDLEGLSKEKDQHGEGPVANSEGGVRDEESDNWMSLDLEQSAEDPHESVLLPLTGKSESRIATPVNKEEKNNSFKEGDWVFIQTTSSNGSTIGTNRRFMSLPRHLEGRNTLGPYQIVGVRRDTCWIDVPVALKIFPVVHKSLLTGYAKQVNNSSPASQNGLDIVHPLPPFPRSAAPEPTSEGQNQPHIPEARQNLMDWYARQELRKQPKKILDVQAKKEMYYLVQFRDDEPRWVHKDFLEDSLDELNQFYAANPHEVKPTFYEEYLAGSKKAKSFRARLTKRS